MALIGFTRIQKEGALAPLDNNFLVNQYVPASMEATV